MLWGIGTDLCSIQRLAKMLASERFRQRVFTAAEQERLSGLCPERQAERAAGMFAAKEAVAKALGTGFSGFGFSDIEILADERGKPLAFLRGSALTHAPRDAAIHLSISHDGGLALAFAVIESKEEAP